MVGQDSYKVRTMVRFHAGPLNGFDIPHDVRDKVDEEVRLQEDPQFVIFMLISYK